MFQENNIETCILSKVKQITSAGWMHARAHTHTHTHTHLQHLPLMQAILSKHLNKRLIHSCIH